jgi:hypothetical protein
MHAFSAYLPFAILLPFAAMLLHGAAPLRQDRDGGRPGDRDGLADRNRGQARAALVFQWVYGVFLAFISVIAMSVPEGLRIVGRAVPLGRTDLMVEPALYLDGRNAPFVLLLGLCLPLIFTWLRDKDGRYGPSYYVSANLLSLSLAGVFMSDSLVLFYLFWETALLDRPARARQHPFGIGIFGPDPLLPVHLGGLPALAGLHHRPMRPGGQRPGHQRHPIDGFVHGCLHPGLGVRRLSARLRRETALARFPRLAPRHL